MDVNSMLNDRPVLERKPSQPSPVPLQRLSGGGTVSHRSSSPPRGAQNGPHATSEGYAPPKPGTGQQTPVFGPPSSSVASTGYFQSRGPTPLHTPQTAGQFPFSSQQLSQSPAPAHPAQQQQYFSATTPNQKPSSHGYGYSQPSPSLAPYGQPGTQQAHSSLSPTPSSHHSQTPQAIRQSPLVAATYPPQYQQTAVHQSQPNTPFGSLQPPQRHPSSQLDVASPNHSRTLSGTSSAMYASPPGQQQLGTGVHVETPNVYNRSSSQRRTSDYLSSTERERSESVSPKTKLPPRPQSLSSRHSSQQEVHSVRDSLPPVPGVISYSGTPNQTQQPATSHILPAHMHTAGDVAQTNSQTVSTSVTSTNPHSLSGLDNKAPLHHSPQKIDMDRLLASTEHSFQNALPKGTPRESASGQIEVQSQKPELSTAPQPTRDFDTMYQLDGPIDTRSSNGTKRAAGSEPPTERPFKRGRKRKYTERPIWAHLSASNPRSREPNVVSNGSQPSKAQRPQPNGLIHEPSAQQIEHDREHPNGNTQTLSNHPNHPNQNNIHEKPWRQNPPLDNELMNARLLLGGWEKSIQWNVPIPPFAKAITNWLWTNLEQNTDVGVDPRDGTIEIEAKIGTLIESDSNQRCNLPVSHACVIDTSYNRKLRFESEMNKLEHKNMNDFLNRVVQESHSNRGRHPIQYEHIRETDSFLHLSREGLRCLPDSAQRRQARSHREMMMRTSVSDQDHRVTARIVKIPIGENLHIFGANDPYDVRISMNLEVNLDRPDIDIDLITEGPSSNKPSVPSRHKDRLSYKHLAFHVDLTRVDVVGMPAKYELELEVDANVVRQQIAAIKADPSKPNALNDIVDGFVNNMTYLMRVPR